MIFLLGGFAALLAGLVIWRTVATMDPARLTRVLRWGGIGVLGARISLASSAATVIGCGAGAAGTGAGTGSAAAIVTPEP